MASIAPPESDRSESAPRPRAVVGTVALGRRSVREDLAQVAIDELQGAGVEVVRNVQVNREKQFIQQLVENLANGNVADAIVLIGGSGIGPRDFTCEAIDELASHRIEGFGEAFRAMLRESREYGPSAFLQRATGGVYNKCLVFALPRQLDPVRRALRQLVIPTMAEGVRIAVGPRTAR